MNPARTRSRAAVLVCGDCRVGLEKLGAKTDVAPRTVTLGYQCDTHPTSARAQAMHAMHAPRNIRLRFLLANEETRPEVVPAVDDPDWLVLAQIAATLAVGSGETMGEDLIVQSVNNARRLISVAKGR